MKNLLLFILAGIAGASLRYALLQGIALFHPNYALLWGVFLVNCLGCFLFGIGIVFVQKRAWNARILLVGFLGSFTTFSSYIADIYLYIQNGNYSLLFSNSFLQIIFGIIFLRFGTFCGHKILYKLKT